MLVKADLHNHTSFSFDGEMNPRRFVERYSELGFGAVAVTDHNTRLGALAVRELDPPFKVIVGCEIGTKDGELIGLFLEKDVKIGMNATDTAQAIHDAGGLVLLPHPFVYMVRTKIRPAVLPELLTFLDIVESVNARGVDPANDLDGALWSRAVGLAQSGGSDAHNASAAGTGYVLMEDFEGREDFLRKLRFGTVVNIRRELLVRSALNFLMGNLFGYTRIQRMTRMVKEGSPLRELWEKK